MAAATENYGQRFERHLPSLSGLVMTVVNKEKKRLRAVTHSASVLRWRGVFFFFRLFTGASSGPWFTNLKLISKDYSMIFTFSPFIQTSGRSFHISFRKCVSSNGTSWYPFCVIYSVNIVTARVARNLKKPFKIQFRLNEWKEHKFYKFYVYNFFWPRVVVGENVRNRAAI